MSVGGKPRSTAGRDVGSKLRTLKTFFQGWTPREVILLAVALVATFLALIFGLAWATELTPLATVWGTVADWAGVIVTALGFLVAGLAFYLQFREVAQDDEQRRQAEEMADLGSTAELLRLASTEEAAMRAEAALVTIKLDVIRKYGRRGSLPGFEHVCIAEIMVNNKTGKKLHDLELHLPHIRTHLGEWESQKISYGSLDGDHMFLDTGISFAAPERRGWRGGPDPGALMGPLEIFGDGDCKLYFRIEGGSRWELTLLRDGDSVPRLAINE